MERIKGYFNLDKENIMREEKQSISCFWFLIQDKEYMCKMVGDEYFCYIELFYQYVAQALLIPTVSYDLASFSSILGVLTESYNPLHYNEVSLKTVLSIFYDEVIIPHQNLFSNEISLENTQNLEDIWFSLLYFYRNRKNKHEIVKSLMNSIVDSFILQICTGNVDMHYDNLWILDSDFPAIAPNFDYGWCGQVDFYSKCNYNLQVVPLSFSCQNSARQTILDFLNYSSQEFVQYFISKVSLMPCATDIFKKIKIQTGVEIPPYVSKQIFTEYQPLKSQILDFVEPYVRKKKI